MVANMQPPRLPVSETDRRRRYQRKMELRITTQRLTQEQRKRQKPNASHSGQGLEVKKTFSTSGRGTRMFLTSPLIDKAFTRSVIEILRQTIFSRMPILFALNKGGYAGYAADYCSHSSQR